MSNIVMLIIVLLGISGLEARNVSEICQKTFVKTIKYAIILLQHHRRSIRPNTCRELGHEGCCKVTVENKGAYILSVNPDASACCVPGEDLTVSVQQCDRFDLL